jgi:hypothetical protein
MNPSPEWEPAGVVAGVDPAASVQPSCTTPSFPPRFASSQLPQAFLPFFAPRTTGARQENLGCFGFPPLPPERNFLRNSDGS